MVITDDCGGGRFPEPRRISGGFLCKKGRKQTQLRVSLDLKQDSGSEAQRVKWWRRAQRQRGKKNVCRSEKSKFHEIFKSIQNI